MRGADNLTRRDFLLRSGGAALATAACSATISSAATAHPISASKPGPPPEWALLQRQLLTMSAEACAAFYDRYFDESGYLLAYVRYGANDGPDDAIENLNNWPLLHAIGADDRIKDFVAQGWEGHLRQFTEARDEHVAIAREAMYYKEFHVQFDWQHHAEGLSVFNLAWLSDPYNAANIRRVKRFAGLYMGEEPVAANWDGQHKIIRSLLTGSRGPMLRDATALDWAGGPFEVGNRFFMAHGEQSYEQTLDHYRDYTEVVGDHPLNLLSTTLALNAYMVTEEPKYREWLLAYVDAWAERAARNDDILPSNIGLDGRPGSAYGDRWWAGVYGWGFSPVDPFTGQRANRNRVPRTILAFFIAYLLTGEDRYLDVWRKQTDKINAQQRTRNGAVETPTMYGDDGWYGWKPGLNRDNSLDIWWFSQKDSDRRRALTHPWLDFLAGRHPEWPATSLRADLETVRQHAKAFLHDTSTPDTRLVDALLAYNPAMVTTLMHQTMGAIHIARPAWSKTSPFIGGSPLFARIRHFDPVKRRAGLPEDTAALVTAMSNDSTTVELVNLHLTERRELVVQGGGYGEHEIVAAVVDGERHVVGASSMRLRLEPGARATVTLQMRRYTNRPTLSFPWDR